MKRSISDYERFSLMIKQYIACNYLFPQVGSEGRKYSFTFEDVESIYNFKNTYLFALAVPKVKCKSNIPLWLWHSMKHS